MSGRLPSRGHDTARRAAAVLLAIAPLAASVHIAAWSAPRSLRPPIRFARQRGPDAGPAYVDAGARVLLRRMLKAEPRLNVEGEQTTMLYDPGGRSVTTTQTVYRDSRGDYRCEFHSPARLAGDVIVSAGTTSWHYMPSRRVLRISRSHPRHLLTSIGPALRALRAGKAEARLIGTDNVAGISAGVVEISGKGDAPTGSIEIWIDPATGAQLRTEVLDASGAPQSLSYFTSVTYNPRFPPGVFSPPVTSPGTHIVTVAQPLKLDHVPTPAEAGFDVLQPSYLPAGFRFDSASVFRAAGRPAVALRYDNVLTVLSVFESPLPPRPGVPKMRFSSPRVGTVVGTAFGLRLAAIGTVDNPDLERVLRSLR